MTNRLYPEGPFDIFHKRPDGRSEVQIMNADGCFFTELMPYEWREAHLFLAEERMIHVSRRLAEAESAGLDAGELAVIRDHLYRGQCNCSYWHGAFGGIYLPHLRNAVYYHLIAADTRLDRETQSKQGSVQATAEDYNFDGLQEVRLSNDQLCVWIAPGRGGRMYELDVREISHNLLATLQRRPESYHRKVLGGPSRQGGKRDV